MYWFTTCGYPEIKGRTIVPLWEMEMNKLKLYLYIAAIFYLVAFFVVIEKIGLPSNSIIEQNPNGFVFNDVNSDYSLVLTKTAAMGLFFSFAIAAVSMGYWMFRTVKYLVPFIRSRLSKMIGKDISRK